MKLVSRYCINCGDRYIWQASGQYIGETPKELNDRDYCPKCKKAILDALSDIEKVSEIVWVSTDEISLDTLLMWEREKDIIDSQIKEGEFPLLKRVYPGLYDTENNEFSHQGYIVDPLTKREYYYMYFPSKKETAVIKIKTRINSKTHDIIDYI